MDDGHKTIQVDMAMLKAAMHYMNTASSLSDDDKEVDSSQWEGHYEVSSISRKLSVESFLSVESLNFSINPDELPSDSFIGELDWSKSKMSETSQKSLEDSSELISLSKPPWQDEELNRLDYEYESEIADPPLNIIKATTKDLNEDSDDEQRDSDCSFKRKFLSERSAQKCVRRNRSYEEEEEVVAFSPSPESHGPSAAPNFQDSASASSSLSEFSGPRSLLTLGEVCSEITMFCNQYDLQSALSVAKEYIPIDPSDDNKRTIFLELFFGIIECSSGKVSEDKCNEYASNAIEIFNRHSLHEPKTCSFILYKCILNNIALPFDKYPGLKSMLQICTKQNIRMGKKTMSALQNYLSELSLSAEDLLFFLEYVKHICKLELANQNLLVRILNKFRRFDKNIASENIQRTCRLMCSVKNNEIDASHVTMFLVCCAKKDLWKELVSFFLSMLEEVNSQRNSLSLYLYDAFVNDIQQAGQYYALFAAAFCEKVPKSNLFPHEMFGLTGIRLLLKAHSEKAMSVGLQLIGILHNYGVQYYSLINCPDYFGVLEDQTIIVLPSYVTFAILDILLHFNQPRNAFMIFENAKWNYPDSIREEFIISCSHRRLNYLIEILEMMFRVDPFTVGLEVTERLLSLWKSDKLFRKLGNSTLIKKTSTRIQNICDKYLSHYINEEKLELVFKLYESVTEEFTVHPTIIRGMVVTCHRMDLPDQSKRFFQYGCTSGIYAVAEPDVNCLELNIIPFWTVEEIQLAFESFLEKLVANVIVLDQVDMDLSELTITFENDSDFAARGVKCLQHPQFEEVSLRMRSVITSVCSGFSSVETPHSLQISSSSLFDYINKRLPKKMKKFRLSAEAFVFGKMSGQDSEADDQTSPCVTPSKTSIPKTDLPVVSMDAKSVMSMVAKPIVYMIAKPVLSKPDGFMEPKPIVPMVTKPVMSKPGVSVVAKKTIVPMITKPVVSKSDVSIAAKPVISKSGVSMITRPIVMVAKPDSSMVENPVSLRNHSPQYSCFKAPSERKVSSQPVKKKAANPAKPQYRPTTPIMRKYRINTSTPSKYFTAQPTKSTGLVTNRTKTRHHENVVITITQPAGAQATAGRNRTSSLLQKQAPKMEKLQIQFAKPDVPAKVPCTQGDFERIRNFLRAKLAKDPALSDQEKQEKATQLAEYFIRLNKVDALNPKVMKLLNDFSSHLS